MTERLYETDGACREFAAVVLSCVPAKDGYAVRLDRTAFFPEGGGQYADTGTLGAAQVTDVQLVDGAPVHYTDRPLTAGETVTGRLDYAVRFARMQHHTGEHIVSGLICRRFGLHNVGFHLGHTDTTLDFDGELTRAQLRDIEQEANAAVAADLAVDIRFPSPEELAQIPYRSKKVLTGTVRLVIIPGVDICACCAPHVSRTGQIGGIKLLDAMRYKGGTRIHMLCGQAAFAAFETLYTEAGRAAAALSAKPEELYAAVTRLLAAREEESRRSAAVRRALAEATAKTLPQNQPLCTVFLPDADARLSRSLLTAAQKRGNRVCAVFSGSDREGYTGVIGSESVDLSPLAEQLRQELSARGGGGRARWQGKIAASQHAIGTFLASRFGKEADG